MTFSDFPKLRRREWIGDGPGFGKVSLAKAQAHARFVKGVAGVTRVKIVKETRWRVLWQQKRSEDR